MRAKLTVMTLAFACVSLVAACAAPSGPPASSYTINPCTTDAGISCDPVFGHVAALPQVAARGELVVFFHGAGAQPQAYQKLTTTLVGRGFHVINLRYIGVSGTAVACPQSAALSDPDCHRRFRAETVFGENVADPNGNAYDVSSVSINLKNSVMNRLLQVVNYLSTSYPTQGWNNFQQRSGGACSSVNLTYGTCDLDWSKIIVMGHSLGSGVALYLSKIFDVRRVGMISGPFDGYNDGTAVTVAPWISEGGFATASSAMLGLQHATEPNAVATQAAWDLLGLTGPVTSVDTSPPNYGGSHELTTSLTPACLTDPAQRHNSTAQDLCTPGSPPQLSPAWIVLAGG